ncbi:MAG: PAS domain-containing protein [Halobacteriales archaeon]
MSETDVRTRLRISEVIRGSNRALVDADTRAELETAVCEAFADSEPYRFAWIGAHDPGTDTVVPRAVAGPEREYLDEISIGVHDAPDSKGPTASAVRTGTVQFTRDIPTDPDYRPWREQAVAHGFASSAAIPLAADGTSYGVLNLYSGRSDAFDETERELLAELGETIGAAVAGIEARNELEERKRQYETLAERVSDAYYAVDDDWTITYWNEAMAALTGTPAEAVLGERLWEAFPELLGTENETEYRAAMETREPRSFETHLGEPFDYWVEIDIHPDDDGLSIFSREITERKERERELEQAERRLDAIIHNTSEAIYIKNRESEYVFINEVGAAVFGAEPEEVRGRDDWELFDEESAEEIRADDRHVMESGTAETWERARHVDGKEHVFIDNKFPYRDGSGEVIGIMGVSRDITERKARERRLEDQLDGFDILNEVMRHDIRNDLQIVLGYADLLSDHVDDEGRPSSRTSSRTPRRRSNSPTPPPTSRA